MITVVLRQHVRLDWRNNVVYRGVIHAVRKAEPGKGRSMCGRYGPRHGRWQVAAAYEVTCVVCLRKIAGLPYHGTGNRNQYDKKRSKQVENTPVATEIAKAKLRGLREYECPRFIINDAGQIVIAVHESDRSEDPILFLVNLGDAMQLAADAAERGLRHEAHIEGNGISLASLPKRVERKLKRIREALGFSY